MQYLEIFDLKLGRVSSYGDGDLILEGEVEHEASYHKQKLPNVLFQTSSGDDKISKEANLRSSILWQQTSLHPEL